MEQNNNVDPGTGVLLTPSCHGEACLGNGENPDYECCCDECDYYLYCFPEWTKAHASIDAFCKK